MAMHEAFVESAEIESDDEGPVGYIDTWYLCGMSPYSTTETRTLRVDQFLQQWPEQAADLWRERIRWTAPLLFHWVHPTPRALATRNRIVHLILQQDPQPHLVPTVVTTDYQGIIRNAFGLASALLENPVKRHWRAEDEIHVPAGAGLIFTVHPPVITTHVDEVHIVSSMIDPVDIHPQEEVPLAVHPPLINQPQIVQELHERWPQFGREGPAGLERIMHIETWYIEGGFIRHNDDQRTVVLGDDYWSWERELSSFGGET